MPVLLNKTYEAKIERIVPRGFGIAFVEGSTVFVALAAPGDRALVEIVEIKGGVAFAEIVRVLEPSPERVQPICQYFGTCGGCDFQQLNYEAQLTSKVDIIRDSLRRIGKIDWKGDLPIIPSPDEFAYRARAQWHVEPERREIGYYKRNSRSLVDIASCPILMPELNSELERMRSKMDPSVFRSPKPMIDISCGDGGGISISSPDLPPPQDITFALGDIRFTFNAGVFFQGNPSLVRELVDAAVGDASGTFALDLYCGVGLFSLPLARRFGSVLGVEESGAAVDLAGNNAEQNGMANIEFRASAVRRFLLDFDGPLPDFVLLDPPRAGTEKETILRIIEIGPSVVSYVSCEPSVLARDLRRFVEAGYQIESITALDMFPQTHHVETVARLTRP